MNYQWLVVCIGDEPVSKNWSPESGDEQSGYWLATREVFTSPVTAKKYVKEHIDEERKPIIVRVAVREILPSIRPD